MKKIYLCQNFDDMEKNESLYLIYDNNHRLLCTVLAQHARRIQTSSFVKHAKKRHVVHVSSSLHPIIHSYIANVCVEKSIWSMIYTILWVIHS
jgi:CRISPR/Cas system-associated endoribonuclease Cas2